MLSTIIVSIYPQVGQHLVIIGGVVSLDVGTTAGRQRDRSRGGFVEARLQGSVKRRTREKYPDQESNPEHLVRTEA